MKSTFNLSFEILLPMDEKSMCFFLQHFKIDSMENSFIFIEKALLEIEHNPKLKHIFSLNYDLFPVEAWRDEEFAIKMIQKNPNLIEKVPPLFRTPYLIREAIIGNPENIIYVEFIDIETALLAAKSDLNLNGKITILDKDYISQKVKNEVQALIEKELLENSLSTASIAPIKKLKI